MSDMGGVKWIEVPVSENLRVIAMNQAITFTSVSGNASVEKLCEAAEEIYKFISGKV